METKHRKVVIVGAGSVGTTYIYTLLQSVLSVSLHEMRFSWWYLQLWPGDFA